ncbi:MAG: replication-relaxation family protein [Candidatus Eisenbacteria bacterium]
MSATPLRQPRNRRRKGVSVLLTVRDETVLHALGRFRIARTSDLVRYAFAGVRPDTAAVRLRRLFDSSHLAVLPPQRGAENVYRLGPAGIRYLAERGIQVGRVPRGGLTHHLAIVHAWVSVAAIADFELERCLPDWELREQFAVGEIHVLPDLLMLVRLGQALHAVAIEVDCGSESQGVLNRKIEAYRALWGQPPGLFGYQRFGVAAACYAPSRRNAVSSALKKAWVVPNVLWLASECPKSALLKLFADLATPLVSSPYRKGTLPCQSEA